MTKMIISKQNLLSEQDRLSIIKDIEFELNIIQVRIKINLCIKQWLTFMKNMLELINLGEIYLIKYLKYLLRIKLKMEDLRLVGV